MRYDASVCKVATTWLFFTWLITSYVLLPRCRSIELHGFIGAFVLLLDAFVIGEHIHRIAVPLHIYFPRSAIWMSPTFCSPADF